MLDESYMVPLSLGFQKDSEFVDLFNYELSRMKEFGILPMIIKTINTRKPSNHEVSKDNAAQVLGFENVIFPFLALSIGIIIASVSTFFEYAIKNHSHRGNY